MRAVAIDRFGGPEVLAVRNLPAPEVGPGEVRIRVECCGVGPWDVFEREGGYAELLGIRPRFPLVLGSECAGTVDEVGEGVDDLAPGDRVYASAFLNPRGGTLAERAVVPAETVAPVPDDLPSDQAGGLAGIGITALRGLEDVLRLRAGESLLVFGASGGIGHVAVQLARRMGARVLAVASGSDGVSLARRLGADAAVDGRADDVVAAARALAPEGLDAALLTAGGAAAERALGALRRGGRIAFPNGVAPVPAAPPGAALLPYNGDPDRDILRRLGRWIEAGPFEVHVGAIFPLERIADAHRAVGEHHLGKIVVRVAP